MNKNEVAEKPLYLGHRARLRARFLTDSGASMPDYELLELLLMMSIPRRDVKPLAKKLIAEYQDLSGVINAPLEELTEFSGIGISSAVLLKIVAEEKRRACSFKLSSCDEKTIKNWLDLYDLVKEQIKISETPTMYIFYFNSAYSYLGKEKVSETVDLSCINKQQLILGLDKFNASAVAIIYNHPEIALNKNNKEAKNCMELKNYLNLLGVTLIDYQIIDKKDNYSYWHYGYIKNI